MKNWRRWCTQTLSALCYLHSSQPPIVHGNINCDTIFISYNGLIKIGAIAPDAIHQHVKTVRAPNHDLNRSNHHFIAPEVGSDIDNVSQLGGAVDIYSFGMCALEMAALEISSTNESSQHITQETIQTTIDSLGNPLQKDFIQQCLHQDPQKRPTAKQLLFHPVIFEVPSLRLLSVHSILDNSAFQSEQMSEESISRFLSIQKSKPSDVVVAEVKRTFNPSISYTRNDFPNREVEKFFEQVKNGAFPLTAIHSTVRPPLLCRQRTLSPEVMGEGDGGRSLNTPEYPYDEETRRVVHISVCIQPLSLEPMTFDVKIVIKLDDKINRQLTCEIGEDQFVEPVIAQELVYYGFINKVST